MVEPAFVSEKNLEELALQYNVDREQLQQALHTVAGREQVLQIGIRIRSSDQNQINERRTVVHY